MMMVDEAGFFVDEDGSSRILLIGLLFAKGSREMTRQSGHVLIKMYNFDWIREGFIEIVFACVNDLGRWC
jgi:hypothetical protein